MGEKTYGGVCRVSLSGVVKKGCDRAGCSVDSGFGKRREEFFRIAYACEREDLVGANRCQGPALGFETCVENSHPHHPDRIWVKRI